MRGWFKRGGIHADASAGEDESLWGACVTKQVDSGVKYGQVLSE